MLGERIADDWLALTNELELREASSDAIEIFWLRPCCSRVIATETFLSRLTEITRMDLLFPELVLLDPPLLGLFVSLVLPS